MKLLQINASYKPAFIYGGPTMSVGKLSEELVKAGYQISVYTTMANGAAELPVTPNETTLVDGVEVTYFKRVTKDHSHFSPSLLLSLWRNAKQYDVIHVHAWWNLVSVFAAMIAQWRNVPVLVSPRGTLSDYSFVHKRSFFKKIFHRLLGKPLLNKSFIHATSSAEQRSLEQIIEPRRIFDIPNFVKLAPSAKTKTYDGPELRLLFFSRIDEKKGLDILLHSIAKLQVPYHLTIAGDGNHKYIDFLKNITQNNNTAQHVSWIGFQQDNKFDVLANHDLMILPSHNENFGNVVIESLSAGTPVLLSSNVGLSDYVWKKNLGWACLAKVETLPAAMNFIALKQKDKLQQISKSAPAVIHADFDEDKLVQRYINMYQKIIAGR